VFVESPGSLTFEMQDIPAIAQIAHAKNAIVMMDNTWGTPLYFKPFEKGVDVSIQATTKYVVGHSDVIMGSVTCTQDAWPQLKAVTAEFGQTTSPDDCYLAARGLRSMAVRLRQHHSNGLALARFIAEQPEVERVLHPALKSDPGHALWKRDFSGACGLFGVVLRPMSQQRYETLIDSLALYGIGASWGGYESLAMPFNPAEVRSATRWPYPGPCFRVHAGLEDIDDLIADMAQAFEAMRATT
jgi:cysteine-S-conjugate beta-lyase